jgi:hypothetical protein
MKDCNLTTAALKNNVLRIPSYAACFVLSFCSTSQRGKWLNASFIVSFAFAEVIVSE